VTDWPPAAWSKTRAKFCRACEAVKRDMCTLYNVVMGRGKAPGVRRADDSRRRARLLIKAQSTRPRGCGPGRARTPWGAERWLAAADLVDLARRRGLSFGVGDFTCKHSGHFIFFSR
jgi:hypothetical protein